MNAVTEILKSGAEDNVSVQSSFIARVHNELYTFYTGKGDLLKISGHWWLGAAVPTPSVHTPFESVTAGVFATFCGTKSPRTEISACRGLDYVNRGVVTPQ